MISWTVDSTYGNAQAIDADMVFFFLKSKILCGGDNQEKKGGRLVCAALLFVFGHKSNTFLTRKKHDCPKKVDTI